MNKCKPTDISGRNAISLDEVLRLGKNYCSMIEDFKKYIGDDKASSDATEVYLLLKGTYWVVEGTSTKPPYFDRTRLMEILCMPKNNVDRAIKLLRQKDLVQTYKKGYRATQSLNGLNCDPWEAYGKFLDYFEWYEDLDNHWIIMNLLFLITELPLGFPQCSRRFLFRSLCLGNTDGSSAPTAKKAQAVIEELMKDNGADLWRKYQLNDYRSKCQSALELRITKGRYLGHYQKAKQLLLYPHLVSQYNFPRECIDVARKARKLSTDSSIRNLYIYEYFVEQPLRGDNDFPEGSVYKGKSLEERRLLLEDEDNLFTFSRKDWHFGYMGSDVKKTTVSIHL